MNSRTHRALLPLTLFALLALLAACSNGVEDKSSNASNSSFELGQVELVSAEVRASHADWPDLKDRALVSLRTCLTDVAYLEKIAGERFAINTPSVKTTRVTNAQGCLNWTETVEFNYLEDEKFIRVSGAIKATGNFRGHREFQLAINPWREQAVDLSFGRVQSTASALSAEQIEKGNRIAVTNASLGIVSHRFHRDQTELTLEVITSPMLVRRNLTGALVREVFNGGVFDISYYLITKNVSTNQRNVISQVDLREKVGEKGLIKSRVNFVIHEGIDPKDVIEVAIKISAHNAPIDLGSTEGLMPIRQLEGTTSSDLLEIPESIAHILNRPKPMFERRPSPDDFGFIIDSVTIAAGAEGGDNFSGNSDRRVVDANFNVCFVDSLIKDSIRNYPFQIKLRDEDGSMLLDRTVTTEIRSGCAVFRASLPYRRFDAQRWRKYTLVVESTREPFQGITKTRVVNINPWIRSGDFGIDSVVGTPPTVSTANNPRIFIPGISYNFLGNVQTGVRVNKGLDLQFSRGYMIEMNPQVFMNHRFEGEGQGQERLMTGNYRLRLLILAPRPGVNIDFTSEVKLDEYFTLTGIERNVSVENGTIRTRIDLPLLFSDLIPFSFKNIILVQLSPLQAGTALQPGHFVGVFNGSRRQDNIGSSLESKRDLSTRDLNITRSLTSRIAAVRNKLAADTVIPNNKNNFVNSIRSEFVGSVPVIDHANYRVAQSRVNFVNYDSEATFKTGQGLISPTPAISALIDRPHQLNAQLVDDLCHVFYNRTTVTKQTTASAGGFGMAMPIDTSITGFEHKRCRENFRAHVELHPFHHVANITAQPTMIATDSGSLTRSKATWISEGNNFSRATGERESDFFQYGWSAHIGGGVAKIVSLGADYGASGGHRQEYYSMANNDRTLAQFKRADNSLSQRYNYDQFKINYSARVIKCLMILPKLVKSEIPQKLLNPTIIDAFRRQGPPQFEVTSSKRIYVCKATTDEERYSESFYFIKNGEAGMMSDMDDNKGQFVSVVRGEKTFQRFRHNMIETDRALVIVKKKDDSLTKRFEHHMQNGGSGIDYRLRLDFAFPGLIEP